MPVAPLSDLRDWELAEGRQDLRGRLLIDEQGKPLGTIEQLMVNTEAERVDSVRTDTGELYPVGALEIRDDTVVFHGVKVTGPTTANVMDDRYRLRRRAH